MSLLGRAARRLLKIAVFTASLGVLQASSLHGSPTLQHERLRLQNTFKTPEEVVKYYCGRDASGFVWTGLLDSERRAFTLWNEAPQQDSFYVARQYIVEPSQIVGHDQEHATVEVKYDLTAISDVHGTVQPVPNRNLTVTFDLLKVNGAWKISKPEPSSIAPVVLESKFPVVAGR